MKIFYAVISAVGLALGSAKADQFSFNDVFSDGTHISGTFSGTAYGDLIAIAETPIWYETPNGITNQGFDFFETLYVADISVSINGTNPVGYYGDWFANGGLVPGSAGIMSFDGRDNNFSFQNGASAPGWSPYASFASGGGTIYAGAYNQGPTERINGDWSVEDKTHPLNPVPDGGSTIGLLAVSAFALVCGLRMVARHKLCT